MCKSLKVLLVFSLRSNTHNTFRSSMMGYIGDKYGSRKALTVSIFLMAFPTFAMGCLPGYEKIGSLSIVLLTLVRLLQGLSVGGQLMSSLVYTLERHPKNKWGLYGSYVMAAAVSSANFEKCLYPC